MRTNRRAVLKKELSITLNNNKVKLLKNRHPVMILSGSNVTRRPLFVSLQPLNEEVIEGLFVKYQLDKFYVNEEETTEAI
ncbi:hypothetical protein KMW28_12560 [Flammeovirga yaeyamensis]|uniref:Uncharacterized protein n=1 Tax=Flammeovirga yaeyamensis TaxID=367791 RepID=A0AAX1MZC4_9BACT|nr:MULTISPECIES: hypothetical protein [Flammeovirga]MBB3695999.1 hypothetical protein [Flammeovirga yaeyamensis]NMF34685.1 hypothetical protein [Flammeovirga yaeyamensis]QJD09407.1 hypothetical protein MY04_06145 [Flammeovirga sp. MY04]QWG00486.1 hypothetical protein KMW28_12560 [Flammeovirga yaeyamensis]